MIDMADTITILWLLMRRPLLSRSVVAAAPGMRTTALNLPLVLWVASIVILLVSVGSIFMLASSSIQSSEESSGQITPDAPIAIMMPQSTSTRGGRDGVVMVPDPHSLPASTDRRRSSLGGNQETVAVSTSSLATSSPAALSSDWERSGFHFEVYGKVQGVSFRKYAQRKVREMAHTSKMNNNNNNNVHDGVDNFQLVGWIRNTGRGTVEGEVATSSGSVTAVTKARKEFQDWLQMIGSPKSHIDKVEFVDLPPERVQKLLDQMDDFVIRKTSKKEQ